MNTPVTMTIVVSSSLLIPEFLLRLTKFLSNSESAANIPFFFFLCNFQSIFFIFFLKPSG